MKKIVQILIIAAFGILLISSCGNNKKEISESEKTQINKTIGDAVDKLNLGMSKEYVENIINPILGAGDFNTASTKDEYIVWKKEEQEVVKICFKNDKVTEIVRWSFR